MTTRRLAALRVTLGIAHVLLGLLLLLPIAVLAGWGSLHALTKLPFSFILIAVVITAVPLWILFTGLRMCWLLTPRILRALQVTDWLAVICALLLCVSGLLSLQAADESAARGGGLLGAFGLVPLVLGILVGGLASASLWLLRYLSRKMPGREPAPAGKKSRPQIHPGS